MTYPPLKDQHCSNCRYRRRHRGEDLCCVRAPELGAAGMMPLVASCGWCGEWAPGEVEQITLTEGRTQRGNGNGGPTTPKPQHAGGRLIGADGVPIGYHPNPSRPGANPPPREP